MRAHRVGVLCQAPEQGRLGHGAHDAAIAVDDRQTAKALLRGAARRQGCQGARVGGEGGGFVQSPSGSGATDIKSLQPSLHGSRQRARTDRRRMHAALELPPLRS